VSVRPEPNRPTLEDVAAYAGVSRSTASRALNNDSYVSAPARDAVLSAAARLGYTTNLAARSLVTRRTGAVALVLSEPEAKVLDDPYFGAVIRAAYAELSTHGGQLLVMFVDNHADVPGVVRFLDGGHVDGALVFAPHRGDLLPGALGALRIPVVFGGRTHSTRRAHHVVDFDNAGGARLAVDHLLDQGRRRIATVSGPAEHPAAADRLTGWRAAMRDRGVRGRNLVESGDFTIAGGEEAMRRLLGRAPELDAVFAASDPMAAGALRALAAAGRRVPTDVAVIGFDDHPTLAPATTPPLTSVHQDPREQIREMVAILLRLIAGEEIPGARVVLPVSLTVRASA
jgi:DNA-binding LacI/PurR family transcriptional regulator